MVRPWIGMGSLLHSTLRKEARKIISSIRMMQSSALLSNFLGLFLTMTDVIKIILNIVESTPGFMLEVKISLQDLSKKCLGMPSLIVGKIIIPGMAIRMIAKVIGILIVILTFLINSNMTLNPLSILPVEQLFNF